MQTQSEEDRSTLNFCVTLSFDVIFISEKLSTNARMVLLDRKYSQGNTASVMQNLEIEHERYRKALGAQAEEFELAIRTASDALLTSFNLSIGDYKHMRFLNTTITKDTCILLEDNHQLVGVVNFSDLYFKNQVDVAGNQLTFVRTDSVPTGMTTLFAVFGPHTITRSILPKTEINSSYLNSIREKGMSLDELVSIRSERKRVIKAMIDVAKGNRSLISIIESVYTTMEVFYHQNSTAEFGDPLYDQQISVWDSVVRSFLGEFLVREDQVEQDQGMDDQYLVHSDGKLREASAFIQDFSLIDLWTFFKGRTDLIRTLLSPDTFLSWLISNRLSLAQDLETHINSPLVDQNLETIVKTKNLGLVQTYTITCKQGETLNFLKKVITEYITTEASARKISYLIKYCQKISAEKGHLLRQDIHVNDELRTEFFRSVINLLIKISGSSIEGQSVALIHDLVMNGVLKGAEGLPLEFFRLVVQKRRLLTVSILRYIFESPRITFDDKRLFFENNLLTGTAGNIGPQVCTLIEEMIKNTNYFRTAAEQKSLTILDVFQTVDNKFGEFANDEVLIDYAIRKNGFSSYHFNLVIAYDQKILLGYPVEPPYSYSRLVRTFNALKNFLKKMNGELLMSYLLNTKCFSRSVIESLEALNEDDYVPFELKLLKQRNRAMNMLGTVCHCITFLEDNKEVIDTLKLDPLVFEASHKLREDINNFTLQQLEQNEKYKDCAHFDMTHLKEFSNLSKYTPFIEKLQGRIADGKCNATQFSEAVKETLTSFKNRFVSYIDIKKFTVEDYETYFQNYHKKEAFYREVLKWIHLKDEDTLKLVDNLIKMTLFIKIRELTGPTEALCEQGSTGLGLKSNTPLKKMRALLSGLNSATSKTLTLSQIEKAEGSSLLKNPKKQDPFVLKLPWIIKEIVESPETLKFIEKNGDKFIKSMREEVDNDNLEIVNKLDTINKKIKFLFNEKPLDLDKAVEKLVQIGDAELERLATYIQSIEHLVKTEITFLADKTKKDSGYSKKVIKGLLNGSLFHFVWAPEIFQYSVSASFDSLSLEGKGKMQTVNSVELEELLNKTLIQASDKSTQSISMVEGKDNEDEARKEQDQALRRNSQFSEVGKHLFELKALLKKSKDLGIINEEFKGVYPVVNRCFTSETEISEKVSVVEQKSTTKLTIPFKKNDGIAGVSKFITDLRKLTAAFEKHLRNLYMPSSALASYYCGKDLFWLLEYLTKLPSERDSEAEEALNHLYDSFPAEAFSELNFSTFVKRLPDSSSVLDMLKYSGNVLTDWTKEIIGRRQTPLEIKDNFFATRRVVVCHGCDGIFNNILRVLKDTGHTEITLSQVLLCSNQTTADQILAFTRRALMDKIGRPYFLIHLHKSGSTGLSEFIRCIELLSDEEWVESNPRIVVFNDNDDLSINMLDKGIFVDGIPLLARLKKNTASNDDIRDLFVKSTSVTEVVVSDVSGMGKSSYIDNKCEGMERVDVFLAGEVNLHTIKKRLMAAKTDIEKCQKIALVIKLDFIEDFHLTNVLVDYTLFCLTLINKFNTNHGCYLFEDKLECIYIEVGNTFSTELLSNLSVLQLFTGTNGQFVTRMPKFDLNDVWFNDEKSSAEQITARFLQNLSSGESSAKTGLDVIISKSSFIGLVKKYFIDTITQKGEREGLTIARYQYWLKTVAHVWKEIEKIELVSDSPGDLLSQIRSELLDFSIGVIGLSVKQVKTSQDEMKRIMKSLDKDKLKEEALAKYQETVKSVMQTWNTTQMIVPLAMESKILFALTNLELFNAGTKRDGRMIELKTYIRRNNMYVNPEDIKTTKTEEYLQRLCTVTGKNFKDTKAKIATFCNTGFSLTSENFMKVCLILFKANMGIPVIMMGESGCGKTYLSRFVAECLMSEPFFEMTLYSGITEEAFLAFMKTVVTEAKSNLGRVWVLFDEFNTSCLQSIVAEIMLDRVCSIDSSIYKIPENIVFLSCCNPYRMKNKMTNVGLVARTSSVVLSHRVYPIPERLIDYVWDFGQLTEEDERSILRGIVQSEKLFENSPQKQDSFGTVLYDCHSFVRDIEERSGVSLRDIKRVLLMYKWFSNVLKKVIELVPTGHNIPQDDILFWALISATMVCYGLRLNGRDEQEEFLLKLTDRANHLSLRKRYGKKEVYDILPNIADCFLSELKKEGQDIIGDDIALNRPLKENFMTMLASFDTVTPMIICGAPGTSKTISTHIMNSALVPKIMKKYPLFSIFSQGVNPIYYGGSETSTSEGIALVFKRGEKYIEYEGEDKPMVIFDEVGLAELSPYNPLKVLHPLLEKKNMKVGFIGLSNWTLDLSKMNRLIFISRPDMEQQDLVEIFESSLQNVQQTNPDLYKILKDHMNPLAKSYLEYRKWQKTWGKHPNFHGSRDIYSVSKYFYHRLVNLSKGIKDQTSPMEIGLESLESKKLTITLISNAIERNFSGEVYEFSANAKMGQIRRVESIMEVAPLESVPRLVEDQAFSLGHNGEGNRVRKLGDIYDSAPDMLGLGRVDSQSKDETMYFNSAQVFKRFFINEVFNENMPDADKYESTLRDNHHVFEQVTSSIKDKNSRFMLIRSEGEVVENILIEKIRVLDKDKKIVDWRGVSNKESKVELFSNIKSYISLGYFVIMKNLDDLYGSLYDLFNQKFNEVDGRKYCYLYFGESKHRVEVHKDFNCLILLESKENQSAAQIEVSQPAPFLNRFEKYALRISDIFPGNKFDELLSIRQMAKTVASGQRNHVLCLNMDMISSICLTTESTQENRLQLKVEGAEMNIDDRVRPTTPSSLLRIYPVQARQLFKLTTLNYLMKPSLSNEELNLLESEHPFTSIREALSSLRSSGGIKKMCVFTFSNPIELDSMKETIESVFKVTPIKSDDLYSAGLETRSRMIRNYTHDMIIIQFTYFEHLGILTQLKSTLTENPGIKKVMLIIHVDKSKSRREILKTNVGLNFWGDWDNRVIDDIRYTDYTRAIEVRDQTLADLFLSDQGKLTRSILQEILVSCFQKISIEGGEVKVKDHLQQIRRAIERDGDDLLIKGLQDKLRDLEFIDNKTEWLSLISRSQVHKEDYVDIEHEMLNLYMDMYGDKTKKIVSRINKELKGFGGYTYGLLSKDREVIKLYKERLEKSLKDIKITSDDLNKQQRTTKDTFFCVPFLSEIYADVEDSLQKDIFNDNKDNLVTLSELNHKLLTIILKKKQRAASSADDVEQAGMSERVVKGEIFLATKLRGILNPLFERITNELGEKLMENPYIKKLILEDVLSSLLEMPRFRFSTQYRQINLLLVYCCVVNSKCKEGNAYNLTETIMTAVYLLGTCLEDIKSITEMIVSAQIHENNMQQVFAELGSINQVSVKSASPFDLNRLSDLLIMMEAMLVPNLLNTDINELRIRLESAMEALGRQKSLRTRDLIDLKFKSVAIALSIIEIIPTPHNKAALEKLEKLREGKEQYGKQLDTKAMSSLIEKLFYDFTPRVQDTGRLTLLLGEYIRMHAQVESFTYYQSDDLDKVLKKLPNHKKVVDSFAAIISHTIGEHFPDFWSSVEKIDKKFNQESLNKPEMQRMNTILSNFGFSKTKSLLVYVHLVDYLYLKSQPSDGTSNGLAADDESILHLLTLLKDPEIIKNLKFSQCSGLMAMVYIRSYTLNPLNKCLSKIDDLLINIVDVKEDFFVKASTYLLIYFMQRGSYILGDIDKLAGDMTSVGILAGIMNSAGDTDLMIVSADSDSNTHLVQLNDRAHAEISKQDEQSFKKLVEESFQGSAQNNWFIFGIALINRFFPNSSSEGLEAIMEGMRNNYKEMVNRLNVPSQIKSIYEIIINGQLPNMENLLDSDKSAVDINSKVYLKLKKTVCHLLLLISCYNDHLGYTFSTTELMDMQGIKTQILQTKFATTDKLSNICSVMFNIIRERLGDGSYQDYGANFGRNLGIYQCSCEFVYSIGNCGYAMEKSKCPKCGKEIGGGNHTAVQRAGHKHIQTLKELFDILAAEYNSHSVHYKVHPLVSMNSTEMLSSGLVKLGLEDYVKNRNKDDAQEIEGQQLRTVMQHLIDHVYLYCLKFILPQGDRSSINNRLESYLKLSDPSNSMMAGKINGHPITNSTDYFANHLRNDIEQIRQLTKVSNISEALNYINYAISMISTDCYTSKTSVEIKREIFFDPVQKLKDLETLKNAQLSSQDDKNKLIRNVIHRKAEREEPRIYVSLDPRGEPTDYRTVIGNVYPLMRHYPLSRSCILDEFKNRVDACPHQFLKAVIRYHYVLQDFPKMVEANLDLTLHLNNNYNGVLSTDESTKADIPSLKDTVLDELFREFRTVWTTVIPKHEETHPDVFSFAFMCNQDLNVASYIERVLRPGGSTLINLMLVSSKETFGGKDILYMKGILRTLMDGFHNKLVKMARKVVALEEGRGGLKKIPMELVTKDDLVTAANYEPVVIDNIWVSGDPTMENEINFNFQRIEYILAKDFLKAEINCEEDSMKFYNFKDSKIIERERLVEGLSSKVTRVQLSREIVNSVQDYYAEDVELSLQFIREVGEYISQNFLFSDENLLLSDLLKISKNTNLSKRFTQFNQKKHGLLVIGHISEYFSLLKDRQFQQQLHDYKKSYSKSVKSDHLTSIRKEMAVLTKVKLDSLRSSMTQVMRDSITQPSFPELLMEVYLDDIDNLPSLTGITWSQYWTIAEAIDDAYKLSC